MKKILISLSIIGIVAAIVVGATTAYFSDTEISKGNTFVAGTIDLAVNGQNPFNQAAIITIPDIKPCETTETAEVRLNNVGKNDGIADLHILLGTSTENIDSEPECEAEGKVWDDNCECCQGEEILNENICEKMIYGYCYDINDNDKCDAEDPQGATVPNEDIDLGLLPAGCKQYKLWLYFHLDGETGNEYQGDTCTFDIEFTLHQISGDDVSPIISFVDIGNTQSEDSKDMKGWSDAIWPASGGVWGGGDDGTIRTVAAVNDDYKTSYDPEDSATVVMDFGSAGTKNLYVRHLDGQSTDDSFNVYVDGNLVGIYTATSAGAETWVTSNWNVSIYTGVHTVKLTLTGPHWGSYNGWGQLGISWIKITK